MILNHTDHVTLTSHHAATRSIASHHHCKPDRCAMMCEMSFRCFKSLGRDGRGRGRAVGGRRGAADALEGLGVHELASRAAGDAVALDLFVVFDKVEPSVALLQLGDLAPDVEVDCHTEEEERNCHHHKHPLELGVHVFCLIPPHKHTKHSQKQQKHHSRKDRPKVVLHSKDQRCQNSNLVCVSV